ncbi:GNAT family N-acetyltransferase [Prauserella cavernicola]|uniref:GNAT family N-acetyltransferase n=1 Tax=Prauserella cavernicola TaxID=2800127 RepID=A0A934V4B5_9PSEU|nr:GNAT family N-acetyltransferase [Prauserella cavernicola]MBK1784539.1 GNAT family N-acetyltransferase [Prauserella cavernicola]
MPRTRPAGPADAGAIGRVHVNSWRSAYAGLPLQGLSITQRQDRWRELLVGDELRANVLVLVDGGSVVGFACAGPSRDADARPDTGELMSLYLDPAAWGRGFGRMLHDDALALLRSAGNRTATLWVLNSNARARRFYEKAGWRADGATKMDTIAGGPPLTEVRYAGALDEIG